MWHTTRIKPSAFQFALEGLVQGVLQQPAAIAAGMIGQGLAALLQHQRTGLEHGECGISAGIEQMGQVIARARAHHQHLLCIAGCGLNRCSGDFVENVVAGNGVLNALAVGAAVVAFEIKRGHRGSAMKPPNDGSQSVERTGTTVMPTGARAIIASLMC